MLDFEKTRLWCTSLAIQAGTDEEASPREKLRETFLRFRERVIPLAADVATHLPDFTVHDISHVDALWTVTDLIMGAEYCDLNPMEVFVLGGVFLVHDLGMALAAYQGGLNALRTKSIWKDTVVALLQQRLDRFPTDEELDHPGIEVERQATELVLRETHAQQAASLILQPFKDQGHGDTYYLIDQPELRRAYGEVIGQIASSHGWSIDQVDAAFNTLPRGAPTGYPSTWTVDRLKLACMLRVADACQLSGRAPGFLRALRHPDRKSIPHWIFQENLLQPQPDLDSNRLVYTSGHEFAIEEAEAWWLCRDTLRMANAELQRVDSLLADSRRPRLAARGIAGVEAVNRLLRLIPAIGWVPVEAQVRVTDVTDLVRKLGGEQLYGHNQIVPLRELIQNASDAVRARRTVQNASSNWGDVYVRTGTDIQGDWVEVQDTGIGMSTAVLTGPLLDFGNSYWGSTLMREEYPGLLAKRFESTGRYGIGFFSVFMWGDRVRVTTRVFRDAYRDTQILEFDQGLSSRPLLRPAREEECLDDGGTRVRVWLREPLRSPMGLLHYNPPGSRRKYHEWRLDQLCAWLCPSLDVNLDVEFGADERTRAVTASDWVDLPPRDLLERISAQFSGDSMPLETLDALSNNVRALTDSSGRVIGRVCIFGRYPHGLEDDPFYYHQGIVTVGGFRATGLQRVAGILAGTAQRAARDAAIPVAKQENIVSWASEQAQLVHALVDSPEDLQECAAVIWLCGGDIGDLPIAYGACGWMSVHDLEHLDSPPDQILLVQDAAVYLKRREVGEFRFSDNVLAISTGIPVILHTERPLYIWPDTGRYPTDESEWRGFHGRTLKGAVVESLAVAWDVEVEDVIRVSSFGSDEVRYTHEVGMSGTQPVVMAVDVIRNPRSV